MRWASEVEEPMRVVFKDGVVLDVLSEDGTGSFIGEGPVGGEPYAEVGFTTLDGEAIFVPQPQIARVVVAMTGEEVEFGNPYLGDHPRPRDDG